MEHGDCVCWSKMVAVKGVWWRCGAVWPSNRNYIANKALIYILYIREYILFAHIVRAIDLATTSWRSEKPPNKSIVRTFLGLYYALAAVPSCPKTNTRTIPSPLYPGSQPMPIHIVPTACVRRIYSLRCTARDLRPYIMRWGRLASSQAKREIRVGGVKTVDMGSKRPPRWCLVGHLRIGCSFAWRAVRPAGSVPIVRADRLRPIYNLIWRNSWSLRLVFH